MKKILDRIFKKTSKEKFFKTETIRTQILRVWDKSILRGIFPHLGSDSHWTFGKIKLSAFRSPEEWLVIMETFTYYNGVGDFAKLVYASGNKLMSSGMEGYADLVHTPKVNTYNLKEMGLHVPYSNMDNIDWCPDPLQFEVKIDGIKRSFSPNITAQS